MPPESWELSGEGREAAARLGTHPDIAGAAAVYSSPEDKARATAAACAGPRLVIMLNDLRELDRSRLGWVTTPVQYGAIVEEILSRPSDSIRGCEPAATAASRIIAAVGALAARHPGQTVVAVSHGIVLSLLMSRLQGIEPPSIRLWRSIRFPDIAVIEFPPGRVLHDFGYLLC